MAFQKIDTSKSLLTEILIRWHIGDWKYLAEIDTKNIEHNSEKWLITIFKAAALFQLGLFDDARCLVCLALKLGADIKLLALIIFSGTHNSLGRAYFLLDCESRARFHIKEAMSVKCLDIDGILLFPARFVQQENQITKINLLHNFKKMQFESKQTKDQLQVKHSRIKEKINQAKQARKEKKYLLANELLSEILSISPDNFSALKEKAIIYAAQQQWELSVKEYDKLLQVQTETENAIRARSLMKINLNLLDEAISDLMHAKALGFDNSNIKYQLATAYRDNKQWQEAENTVRELCSNDPNFLLDLSFATFVADLLRKRGKVKEGYGLLVFFVTNAQLQGHEIPLNTKAILGELKRAINSPTQTIELSRHYYDAIYAQSEKYQNDAEFSIYTPAWDKVIETFKKEHFRSVLDVGCGPGQFAEYLLRKIPHVYYQGIDYSQTAIEAARLRCTTAQFYVNDLMHDDILKEFEADVYVVLEVLEHIEHDLDLLSRLKKNKKIIMSVPNFDAIGHVRFFSSQNEIYERYSKKIIISSIDTISLKKRSSLFLVNGVIR